MSNDNLISEQIEVIRAKYPQTHAESGQHGQYLIIIPSVLLPKNWNKTICTVLFIADAGFPCIRPENFWIDIPDLRITNKGFADRPHYTNNTNPIPGFPHWTELTWFGWRVQDWLPTSTLYTYLMVIRQRLHPAR